MPRIAANGIDIEYETHGSPNDPAVLVVCGFTQQLIGVDPELLALLADQGRYVIVYDNRDVGLSTKFTGQPAPVAEIFAARKEHRPAPAVPYSLSDMAADGMGLLSALGIERAHIMGNSMGGMLVQVMAIEHPHRVKTMTSVMSTTGNPEVGRSTPEANAALLSRPAVDRADYVAKGVEERAVWSSKKYYDRGRAAKELAALWDRGINIEGNARQLCAILTAPNRDDMLSKLTVPSLVIHGNDDTLIERSGGIRTAEVIPGAMLALVNDMGHDWPKPLWPLLVDLVVSHQNRYPH